MYLIAEELPTFIKTAVDFYSNLITLFFLFFIQRLEAYPERGGSLHIL